jgi:hypothetical protein
MEFRSVRNGRSGRRSVGVRVTCGVGFVVGATVLNLSACITTNNPIAGIDASLPGFDAASPAYDSALPNTDATLTDATAPGTDAAPGSDAGPSPDAPAGSCPAGWVSGAGGLCFVNLLGAWAPSTDANSDGPDTVATLGTVTSTSVSVVQSHTGSPGADCGCNSQHLNIPLGKTFSCASSTLSFDFTTTTTMTSTNVPGVDIRFCTGPCPSVDGGAGGPYFYTGAQYVGSPFAPATSSCGYEWENDAGTASLNYFPASAAISTSQTNVIALGTYVAPASGDDCSGSFDTIDVHMQVYNCFPTETGTNTLSNLRVY